MDGQSDLFSSAEGNLVRNPARVNPVDPSIDLGPEFHKVLTNLAVADFIFMCECMYVCMSWYLLF